MRLMNPFKPSAGGNKLWRVKDVLDDDHHVTYHFATNGFTLLAGISSPRPRFCGVDEAWASYILFMPKLLPAPLIISISLGHCSFVKDSYPYTSDRQWRLSHWRLLILETMNNRLACKFSFRVYVVSQMHFYRCFNESRLMCALIGVAHFWPMEHSS